jgi:hypothetical protein
MTPYELKRFLLNGTERLKERELFGPAEGPTMSPVYHPPTLFTPKKLRKTIQENFQTVRITNKLTVYLQHTIPIDR